MRHPRSISLLVSLWIVWPAAAAPPAWRIYTQEAAVYRVSYESLTAAGSVSDDIDSANLSLENRGESVPLWVEDGGDGTFGPGDSIEFVSEILPGENAHFHDYSNANVYRLSVAPEGGQRMTPIAASRESAAGESEAGRQLWRRRHLEADKLLARLSGSNQAKDTGPAEPWFWAKLAHNRKPWTLPVDLSDLDPESNENVVLRVHFRALSEFRSAASKEIPDHRVEISLDGTPLAVAEWDKKAPFLLETPGLEASLFAGGARQLEIRIPERFAPKSSNPIVDVVMLNWIEIDYPMRESLGAEPVRLHLATDSSSANVRLSSTATREITVYGNLGSRINMPGSVPSLQFEPREGESSYHVVPDEQFRSPERIEIDQPSDLRTARRVDYLMITHRRLHDAILPLAEFHRGRGLEVALIDVQDIYDEFNHGIIHPIAIRDFIAYAHDHWREPTPRFVLLAGDASWDTKNTTIDDANYANWSDRQLAAGKRFARKGGDTYEVDPKINLRQLVPTWNYTTYQGHAASDNHYVAVDGDDYLPDLAIGRLPVATPEEIAQIVAKTVRYASRPEVGPWRRSAVLITNESKGFQVQSDGLALQLAGEGLSSQKLYPASTEVSNEHHTRRLIETLDRGQLFVHFLGHGGRYIWRTGPPDFNKNHDLFTLDHLDELAPTGRLPVVLSLTCFSAPFDHPNADSIGEKLLRIPDRGAVAVFAASWRNTPSASWGIALLEELTAPGATIGEAVMRAKHQVKHRMFVETYNLLGDPAVPVALPTGDIDLNAGDPIADHPLKVQGVIGLEGFAGKILVDLVDAKGEALHTTSLDTGLPEFAVELEVTPEQLASARLLRAYAWNVDRGVDAVGTVELPQEDPGGGGATTSPRR